MLQLKLTKMSKFITVEGNIGSGKTTFLKRMEEELGSMAKILLEPVSTWLLYVVNFRSFPVSLKFRFIEI